MRSSTRLRSSGRFTSLIGGDGPVGPQLDFSKAFTFPRFTPTGGPGEYSRVIQVAEALGKAWTVLQETYTAAAWTDEPFSDTSKTVQVDVPSRYDRIYLT